TPVRGIPRTGIHRPTFRKLPNSGGGTSESADRARGSGTATPGTGRTRQRELPEIGGGTPERAHRPARNSDGAARHLVRALVRRTVHGGGVSLSRHRRAGARAVRISRPRHGSPNRLSRLRRCVS